MVGFETGNNLIEDTIVVGVNDYAHLTEGWFDRVIDGRNGIVYRVTQSQAKFRINKADGHNWLLCLVSASPSITGKPFHGELCYDQKVLGKFELPTDNWVIRRFDISAIKPGIGEFWFDIKTTFIPDLYLHNGDFRRLGISVAAIRLS